ncbi:MAG TPA: adenine nucleotide alpha hydrolase family protein [Nanoarchaeota archaeon]|nr:adenine nucleotide alpha hydrolase family protein [Nanoarchaeota archaeon]
MLERIKSRIFKTIKKHKLVENRDKIFVALSGGKDSATVLFALKEYIEKNNINCELKGMHINFCLNISEKIQKIVEKQAKLAEIELEIIYLKDLGIEFQNIIKKTARSPCSICGVIKRYLMNKIPREKGANKIATGHNMDDFIVFFFKNFLNKNFEWISKFKPKIESEHKKLITKIRPLFYVGNKECELFCKELGIEYTPPGICPYTPFKSKKWYEIIYNIEKLHKEFRYQMAKSIASSTRFFENLYSEKEILECKLCGEPTEQEICGFCKLKLMA